MFHETFSIRQKAVRRPSIMRSSRTSEDPTPQETPGLQDPGSRKTASSGGFGGTERAGTRSDGRKQCRNSADGCGEDRASVEGRPIAWRAEPVYMSRKIRKFRIFLLMYTGSLFTPSRAALASDPRGHPASCPDPSINCDPRRATAAMRQTRRGCGRRRGTAQSHAESRPREQMPRRVSQKRSHLGESDGESKAEHVDAEDGLRTMEEICGLDVVYRCR